MYTFDIWVRLNAYQTTHVFLQASDAWTAKLLAEAMYGQGNVFNYTQVNS